MNKMIEKLSITSFLSTRIVKFIVVNLVFLSIVINCFVPKDIENREYITNVIGAVLSSVVVKTIKDCTQTLMVMSDKITKDLYRLLTFGETGTNVPVNNGQKEENSPVNTSSDIGIEIENRDREEIIRYSDSEDYTVLSVGKIEERLYRLYENIKVYCNDIKVIGLLFFIIFIVAIEKRKEEIEGIIKGYRKDKTNLCN